MSVAIYTDVIVYCYDARKSISDLIHSHLKYILRHFKTKWHKKDLWHPLCVLNVVKCEDGVSWWMLQKLSVSNWENTLMHSICG